MGAEPAHADPAPWWPLHAGDSAPSFRLRSSDNRVWSLAMARGRSVWLSFGASWCPWCERQLPLMIALASTDPAHLVVIQIDEERRVSRMAAWQKRFGAGIPPSFHMVLDANAQVANQYRVQAYPTSFFIGPAGHIRRVYFGALTTRRELVSFLCPLFKATATSGHRLNEANLSTARMQSTSRPQAPTVASCGERAPIAAKAARRGPKGLLPAWAWLKF